MQLFGTKGQQDKLKNLAKGQDRLGEPVIQDGTRDGTEWDFDSCPFPSRGTNRDRAEKDSLKQEKDILKLEKDVLKQERMF